MTVPKDYSHRIDREPPEGLSCPERTRTKQAFKRECDINTIMTRYSQTGLLPQGTQRTALYGDFTQVDDYLQAVLTVQQAEQQLDMLPSKARERFKNDPVGLLHFIADPANKAAAQELGLLTGETPAPKPAPPVDPTAPPAKP